MTIALTFDWFRNLDGNRAILSRNVNWTFHYLKSSGAFTTKLPDLTTALTQAGPKLTAAGLCDTHHTWAMLYDQLARWPDLAAFFLQSCPTDTVLGFELSRAQKSLLDHAGKTYIDMRTHPVRFLPDYMFAAATNAPDIHEKLIKLAPPHAYIAQHAHFCEAKAARRFTPDFTPNETVVFFAQTAVDSSKIREGQLVDDTYILCQIEDHLTQHPAQNFYVKHHPHEPMPQRLLSALKKLGAQEISANTYDLLSLPGLSVLSLSSSIGHEAQYFDVVARNFLAPTETFAHTAATPTLGDYIMLPSNLHSPAFWDHLLGTADAPRAIYPEFAAPYKAASGLNWG